ncbi:F-box/WD repeat-containing protein-like protein lin-23 [Periconia macrospinosa]|uniref:F-box/WD repeat-containing protein-like protein lin-23 n=1 Tax=Periconia macrospinosa TaxID=97972 RepID=A0A2V1DX00_9PLEO|nr:F-box/WD repeat-containing protein-like protein lin-23 [Periconia macrospinosa]
MHRRSSIALRPKTSSAVDDSHPSASSFEPTMKRTASQTFSTHTSESRDAAMSLGAVQEGMSARYPSQATHTHQPYLHTHTSSLSRATHMLEGSFKQIRRKLSSSSGSTRRPSIQNLFEQPAASSSRKTSADPLRLPLPHQDSGLPILPQQQDASAHPPSATSKHISMLRRFSSLRRRPAASGPSGDFAKYNPVPPPIPSNYPVQAPGTAARQAAAAANDARQTQLRREQEQTRRFLEGDVMQNNMEEVIKDSESGVGMMCSSPINRNDGVTEKKMVDPLDILPAEITTIILSNLDAPSLIQAELVSKRWHEIASSPHVWKGVFLRKFEPTVHVSPTPIQMGGVGVGKFNKKGKHAPGQDWKRMFQARKTINRRWKACSPSAIYLNGHTDSVYCCQFDEDKIITGSRDRTIRVWDMKTYECVKVIGGPTHRPLPNTPHQLDTHKDTKVNNPSLNGTARGNEIYRVPADYHDASILCLQYDDEIMVTGSSDHTCIVWDITGDEFVPLHRLRGHQAGVLDVCLDKKHIISCSKDSAIIVWDRQTGRQIRTLQGHRGPVNAVQLRGNLLVSASGDGVAKLWNLDSGNESIKDFPSEDRGLAAVEFSDDANIVLAGGNDHVVYKFDATTGKLLHTSQRHGGLVRSLFLDAFNERIISGSYDQSIRIADYATGEVFANYENWTTSWILSAKSDYRRVVATSQDGRTLILDFGWNVQGSEMLISAK